MKANSVKTLRIVQVFLSIALLALSITINDFCLGDIFLLRFGLSPYAANGVHIPVIFSIGIILAISIAISFLAIRRSAGRTQKSGDPRLWIEWCVLLVVLGIFFAFNISC